MTDRENKDKIQVWAAANMEDTKHHGPYPMWETTWCSGRDHLNFRLRLSGNDVGADIVILVCAGGYGAAEDDWNGINLGVARSVEQIEAIYNWLKEKAKNE